MPYVCNTYCNMYDQFFFSFYLCYVSILLYILFRNIPNEYSVKVSTPPDATQIPDASLYPPGSVHATQS